ncbi:MAG: bifunctional glycosyltransferase family 2 protein/CDP-glycerol:glycerophosphate glycerophosphotransferase [Propionibacteriaceae bacterium]|nr:bifunctional glycosyltransferase family 2 protein/CDP-glycerol:glycerophosphate glycerophosphotransferase [Propionibacteriaceae bacterium]
MPIYPGMPRLSVVIAAYNTEDYIAACLDSLRRQKWPRFQVIVVDDGSTDATAEIAEAFAAADRRFLALRQPNRGPGAARNIGAAQATGKYIAFFDSDDVVYPGHYRNALLSLLRTGSDFAVAPYTILTDGQDSAPPEYITAAHRRLRRRATLRQFPDIMVNALMCARVYRRDFYMEQVGPQPEGVRFEDQLLAARAFAKANAFDILTRPALRWRRRGTRDAATQLLGQPDSLRSRTEAFRTTLDYLQAEGLERERTERLAQILATNQLTLGEIGGGHPAYFEIARDFLAWALAELDSQTYQERVPVQARRLHDIILNSTFETALSFVAARGLYFKEWVFEADPAGGLAGAVPYWSLDLETAGAPRTRCPSQSQLVPASGVEAVKWDETGNRLLIRGAAYVGSVRDPNSRLEARLAGRRGGPSLPAAVRRAKSAAAAEAGGHFQLDYADCGFELSFPIQGLTDALRRSRRRSLAWDLNLEFQAGGITARGPVQTAWGGERVNPRHDLVLRDDGIVLRARHSEGRGVVVRAFKTTRALTAGRAPSHTLPMAGWSAHLTALDVRDEAIEFVFRVGARRAGDLKMAFVGEQNTLRATLRGRPDGQIAAVFDPRLKQGPAWRVPLAAAGLYELRVLVRPPLVCSDLPLPITVAEEPLWHLADKPVGRGRLRLFFAAPSLPGRLRFRLTTDGDPTVRLPHAQRALQTAYRASRPPLKPVIYTQCLAGDAVDDSQLALARRLAEMGRAEQIVWGIQSGSVRVPRGQRSVIIGTSEYYETLRSSAVVCVNHELPAYFTPRSGQTVVQTYHGHPFKMMGVAWWRKNGYSDLKIKQNLERMQLWDVLVSPSPLATRLYREYTPVRADFWEIGAPRNDRLVDPPAGLREELRQCFGIRPDQRAILYAPTWRGYATTDPWRAPLVSFFDPSRLLRQLGGDYVMIFRAHPSNRRAAAKALAAPGIIDATGYPDVNDLILASDIGLFDYSSIRFDYLLTGLPMAYFTPDEKRFFADMPPLWPYEDSLAGPRAEHADGLPAAIHAALDEPDRWRGRAAALRQKVAPFDDGAAAARLAARLIAETGL